MPLGTGEAGTCGSGSGRTMCSPVQTDSNPAASAACATRTAVTGSLHGPMLMPNRTSSCVPARRLDALAGQPAGLVRGEERHGARDVVRPAGAAERRACDHLLRGVARGVQPDGFGALGEDVARIHRVDADVFRRELHREHTGHGVERALRRRVDDQRRRRLRARDRADVDDGPARRPEVLDRLLGREKRAEDVRVEVPAVLGLRDLFQRLEVVHPGVVHEHVEPPERLARLREEPPDVAHLRDVTLDGDRRAAGLLDLGDDALGARLARRVIHDHRSAPGGQLLRDPGADAFRRPGDPRYLARQLCHESSCSREVPSPRIRISSYYLNYGTADLTDSWTASQWGAIPAEVRPLFHPSIDDVTVEGILHALSDPLRAHILVA